MNIDSSQLRSMLEEQLQLKFSITPAMATPRQMYEAVIYVVREILQSSYADTVRRTEEQGAKQVYYMSMEFLVGRSLKNNLHNLGLEDMMRQIVKENGNDLDALYEMEPDAGLGNGGLGRLASCYLDALTAQDYPATGFSIRYEFGIFKQVILDGWQTEFPDNWLEMGGAWLVPRPDETQEVFFDGEIEEIWSENGLKTVHKNYDKVLAVPYDLLISGHGTDTVNRLRLWGAKSSGMFDMSSFSRGDYLKSVESSAKAEAISKVLYPADDHIEGKNLRLRQQYFFVCASLKNIVSAHFARYKTLDNLADKVAIHINDTHPSLCVPELMRILMDDYDYEWNKAWEITTRTLAYTNHTVMSEALEVWSIDMFRARLPRIYSIIEEINRRFCSYVYENHPALRDRIDRVAILSGGMVHMANLCVACCYSVNGVSALHSDILKKDLFADYHAIFPEKLTNVTNGIIHRRWLCQANPLLTNYLTELIGDDFIKDASHLKKLAAFDGNADVYAKLAEIKLRNKERLADYIRSKNGINVDPTSIFDVQAKRLHEYKRQLLCAMYIYSLYRRIKHGGETPHPRTFIFGAKASAGYIMAKEIIRFICSLANLINNDPVASKYLKVVFLADYKVSIAEILMPAAQLSEQISLAGKEASGTGNMKFMINGAVTIGTLDGANVEIHEQVGDDNIFLFGMKTDEVNRLRAAGYQPRRIYEQNGEIRAMLDALAAGEVGGNTFDAITGYLLNSDPYMVLADFESYAAAQRRAEEAYRNPSKWGSMSLQNIAGAGFFAADRATKEYADNIWKMEKLK